jgi:hypothetical protein
MKKPHEFARMSPMTGKMNTRILVLDMADYEKWATGGGLIQNLLPYLSADDREFLMTGILPNEWEELFKESKQEEADGAE